MSDLQRANAMCPELARLVHAYHFAHQEVLRLAVRNLWGELSPKEEARMTLKWLEDNRRLTNKGVT